MSDQNAFLNAIKVTPADDAPRLVYADWLEENAGTVDCDWCRGTGEDRPPNPVDTPQGRFVYTGPLGPCPKCKGDRVRPDGRRERAELIRGQCEFVRLGRRMRELRGCSCTLPGHVPLYGDPEVVRCEWCRAVDWRRKWERKQPVVSVAAMTTFYPPGEFAPDEVPIFEFDRGFVRAVAAPWPTWLRTGDHLLSREWVPRVALTTWPPGHDLPGAAYTIVKPTGEQFSAYGSIHESKVVRCCQMAWPSAGTWELPDHSAYMTAVAGADIAPGQLLTIDADGHAVPYPANGAAGGL